MEGWALFNLAECQAEMNMVEPALEYCNASKIIFDKLKDDLGMSGVYMAYAIAYRKSGDWVSSKENFIETLKIREQLKMPYRLADARLEFAIALQENGESENACEQARAAREIFEELANSVMVTKASKLIEECS